MKRFRGTVALLLLAAGTVGCAADAPGAPDAYLTRLDAIARHDIPQTVVITDRHGRMLAFTHDERFEQSLERKIREAQLASEVSARFTKDQILEAYLNIAYFGHQAYGVEAAANVYFGRPARNLSLGESTLLAGLPQAPASLDPFKNPDGALQR